MTREKAANASNGFSQHYSCGGWIDAKSFLAGMLVVGFLAVFQENLVKFNSNNLHAIPYVKLRDPGQKLVPSSSTNGGGDNSSIELPAAADNKTYEFSDDNYTSDNSRDQTPSSANYDQLSSEDEEGAIADSDTVPRKRTFQSYGNASALFVHMGSYRGGPDSFAVIGLASKPAHVYGNAGFECEWVPAAQRHNPIKGSTEKMLPDWNMGRQYTVVVVNCSFQKPVGVDGRGGELVVYAIHGEGSGRLNPAPERFVALTERQNQYAGEKFRPPYPYDFVYCGSPLFSDLNPQRIREWIAYHVRLFGPRSHFFLHDAGGVTDGVKRALRPWIRLGYVTVHDIREQEVYDGYYHNQFLVVNDCFHRTRFLSNWTFFFDVDEYLYVPPNDTLRSVMEGFSDYTQVIFRQKPMSADICQATGKPRRNITSEWGFEKLVYRNVKGGITWDRKYAIQPRNAFTTGVHRSDHMVGQSLGYFTDSLVPKLWYYHYHNTITEKGELCRTFASSDNSFVNSTSAAMEPVDVYDADGVPVRLDTGLQELAESVKKFELQQIGRQPTIVN